MDNLGTMVVAGLIVLAASFVIQYFGLHIRIQTRLAKIETKVDLFWRIVEDKMSEVLHSPTHFKKDALLGKMKKKELSIGDAVELRVILSDELKNGQKDQLAVAYTFVIARLDMIIGD